MAAKDKDETAAPSVTLTLAELKELLGTNAGGLDADTLEKILTRTAEMTAASMQKALKPENTHHPGISFGSYPEGDRLKPRPVLPFELLWKGFPIHREIELSTYWELEQYARLKPGAYTVSRRDGAPLKVTATAQYAPDGETIERLIVDFDCDRDVRPMVAPPYIMAYQMNHPHRDRQETFVEGMTNLLQIELADRRAKASKTVAA